MSRSRQPASSNAEGTSAHATRRSIFVLYDARDGRQRGSARGWVSVTRRRNGWMSVNPMSRSNGRSTVLSHCSSEEAETSASSAQRGRSNANELAVAIAPSRHRAIAPSRHRAIAPSRHRAIAPSRRQPRPEHSRALARAATLVGDLNDEFDAVLARAANSPTAVHVEVGAVFDAVDRAAIANLLTCGVHRLRRNGRKPARDSGG